MSLDSTQPSKRPIAITVICVLGFLGALFIVPIIFSDVAHRIGAWYPPYLAFSAIVGFICMIGLWQMRKWSVFIYTALVALNQVVLLAMGTWHVLSLIPAIVVAIGVTHLSKMT